MRTVFGLIGIIGGVSSSILLASAALPERYNNQNQTNIREDVEEKDELGRGEKAAFGIIGLGISGLCLAYSTKKGEDDRRYRL